MKYQPLLWAEHSDSKTKPQDRENSVQTASLKESAAPRQVDPVEIFRGTGVFVGSSRSSDSERKSGREGVYTLNFENAELAEVIRIIIADTLKKNYVIDPKITGKVSMRTTKPLTEDELLSTLEMLLKFNNAVLLKKGDTFQVQLATNALESGVKPKIAGKDANTGQQLRIIPLSFVSANQIYEIIKPLLPSSAVVKVDTSKNLIMIVGNSELLDNVEETINLFDVNTLQGLSFGLFPLHHVDPETIEKELSEIFGYNAGGPLEDLFKIVPIERLNALLVITPQAQYLEQIKVWLTRLDRAKKGAKGSVHVYRVQHVKATDLAATLNEIFVGGNTATAGRRTTVAPGQQSDKISNRQEKPIAMQATSPRPPASASSTDRVGDVGAIRIIPDEANNSVFVVASDADYTIIKDVIKQLDVMPLQVHIDASILSVQLNDNIKYGMEWAFNNTLDGQYTGVGTLGDLAIQAAFPGFSYIISKARDVRAVLHALAEKKDINVISSPSLMVLNNQEAVIQVGDQVPVRTTESINTGGANNPIQTSAIEMRDTGVMLKVKPRVNAGGVVIMDIEQSVDTPSKTSTSSIDSPTILKRSITSSVAVDSGETIVLGGLISETVEDSQDGIPLLKDIPGIGSLFGTSARNKIRNELIVLITPQAVENRADARSVTREYKRKLHGIFAIPPAKTILTTPSDQ